MIEASEVIALVLALDVSLIVTTATLVLLGRAWTQAAPRTAVLLWLACGLSVVLSLVALITVAVLPPGEAGPQGTWRSCLALLEHRLSSAHLFTPTVLLGVLAAAALLRTAVIFARCAWSGVRVRRVQRRGLDLLRRASPQDPHVLPADRPVAYSVPGGGGGRVVVTSGAVALLAPDEMAAVLAHERAHLRGRHHLLLLMSRVARDLLPSSRWLHAAHREIAELLELAADDTATRTTGRAPVARAVTVLAGAAGPALSTRLRRLSGGTRVPAAARLAVTGLAALLIGLPATAAMAPVALTHAAHDGQ